MIRLIHSHYRREVMDHIPELKRVAEVYRGQGYDVIVRPEPGQLPPFARDFQVEIVGRRGGEGVLVAVRRNREELAADEDMQRYAEVTGRQPGWRFDFAILEGEDPQARDMQDALEFSRDDLLRSLEQVEDLGRAGFVRYAVIAAWAMLEAAMRMRLRTSGREAGWGSMPRQMLRELYSAGILTPDEFHRIEQAFRLRNRIVHGFAPSPAEPNESDAAVARLLGEVALRLIHESHPVKQSA